MLKQQFSAYEILQETIYLAVPNNSPYAKYPKITLAEVKNEKFVHLMGSKAFRSVCDGFCLRAGFRPQTAFESDSLLAVRNIIGANVGIGFWPAYSWGSTKDLGITLLPISAPECKRELIIGLHKTASPSACAEHFFQYLVDNIKKRQSAAPMCSPI